MQTPQRTRRAGSPTRGRGGALSAAQIRALREAGYTGPGSLADEELAALVGLLLCRRQGRGGRKR